MKRIFGVALLALPLAVGSVHAEGWPFSVQAGGSFYIRGSNGCVPQAGPWYLYWPMEAHFVAPAPTGYPYWPPPQGLPPISFGGPAVPPPPLAFAPAPAAVAPQAAAAAPVAPPATTVPVVPPIMTMPVPGQSPPQFVPPQPAPQATTPAQPQLQLPPYLQPTSYYPLPSSGQPPSYWYDR